MPMCINPTHRAHSEGLTCVTYDNSGAFIITAGSDGVVKLWDSVDDDSPQVLNTGDCVYALAVRNSVILAAGDGNNVNCYKLPDLTFDGSIVRFTSPPTCIDINSDASYAVIGSSDFNIKIVSVEDSLQKVLVGHTAPVLGVAYDPCEDYVVSSSCDGSYKLWKVSDKTCVNTWLRKIPAFNDVDPNKSLARMSWQPGQGQYLAIPVGRTIEIYTRNIWERPSRTFVDAERINASISVVKWSYCGEYLASACLDGTLQVWEFSTGKLIEFHKHKALVAITDLSWHPDQHVLAYVDALGNLTCLSEVIDKTDGDLAGLIEEADDEIDESGLMERDGVTFAAPNINDDDLSMVGNDREFMDGYSSAVIPKPYFPVLQAPFQPGSCPVNLTCRFMVWNTVGIVRSYREDGNLVEVEFHDTSVHHSLTVVDPHGYTMADLSDTAVIFASPVQEDLPCQLMCMHFASWDNANEWTLSLSSCEEAVALCLGRDYVAVATDKQYIRLFSLGGLQLSVFSVCGPVVCVRGYGASLNIIFHDGMPLPACQSLSYLIYDVSLAMKPNNKAVYRSGRLPVSPESTLVWAGYSVEGTPCFMDSEGVVRLLYDQLSWMPVANLFNNCTDHPWLVTVEESSQMARVIMCKGNKFPLLLPRPVVCHVDLHVPLCSEDLERTWLEDKIMRSNVAIAHLRAADKEDVVENMTDELNVSLMKLLAISGKSGRLYRALECSQMMEDEDQLLLAIKYASKSRLMVLANKIQDEVIRRQEDRDSKQAESEASANEEIEDIVPIPTSSICVLQKKEKLEAASTTTNVEVPFESLNDSEDDVDDVSDVESEGETDSIHENKESLFIAPLADVQPSPLTPVITNPFKTVLMSKSSISRSPLDAFDQLRRGGLKSASSVKDKSRQRVTEKEKPKPKRRNPSLNGYMLWLKDNRSTIQSDNPNTAVSEISKIAGKLWKDAGDDVRKRYNEMSIELKKSNLMAAEAKTVDKDVVDNRAMFFGNLKPSAINKRLDDADNMNRSEAKLVSTDTIICPNDDINSSGEPGNPSKRKHKDEDDQINCKKTVLSTTLVRLSSFVREE